jgi:hypothetical protein
MYFRATNFYAETKEKLWNFSFFPSSTGYLFR